MLILFLVLFFLLQALVLFCCLAAGNDPHPENFRSGTDGLYQTVDGEAFRVMNIKNRGYNSHL